MLNIIMQRDVRLHTRYNVISITKLRVDEFGEREKAAKKCMNFLD